MLGRVLAGARIRISTGQAAGAGGTVTYCRSRCRSSRSVLWNDLPQPGQSHCRVESLWFCWCLLRRQSARCILGSRRQQCESGAHTSDARPGCTTVGNRSSAARLDPPEVGRSTAAQARRAFRQKAPLLPCARSPSGWWASSARGAHDSGRRPRRRGRARTEAAGIDVPFRRTRRGGP